MSETTEINIAEIKAKLYEKLKSSQWGDKLKGFLLSTDFDKIIKYLQDEVQEDRRFTPPLRDMFKAFTECPYKDLKVIFLLQDPYPALGVASGLAMCCENTGILQPSLKYVYQQVHETVYKNEPYEYNPSLKHWANQGVLLLNTALTTTVGKTGTHYDIWKPFMVYLLDILSSYNPGLIYVYFGKVSQEWMDFTLDNNHKIIVSHPASAAYAKAKTWDSQGLFPKINEILLRTNNLQIKW